MFFDDILNVPVVAFARVDGSLIQLSNTGATGLGLAGPQVDQADTFVITIHRAALTIFSNHLDSQFHYFLAHGQVVAKASSDEVLDVTVYPGGMVKIHTFLNGFHVANMRTLLSAQAGTTVNRLVIERRTRTPNGQEVNLTMEVLTKGQTIRAGCDSMRVVNAGTTRVLFDELTLEPGDAWDVPADPRGAVLRGTFRVIFNDGTSGIKVPSRTGAESVNLNAPLPD